VPMSRVRYASELFVAGYLIGNMESAHTAGPRRAIAFFGYISLQNGQTKEDPSNFSTLHQNGA
jgi:hypothetical protein